MTQTCIIYHAHCPDGFGAAWAAWLVFKDTASYHPTVHGESPPDVKGKDVFIIDFSFNRTITEQIAASAKSLVVLDHHKSAVEEIGDLPYVTLDMKRSGAGMSWDYFHRGPRSPLINHIEDRDLWKWTVPFSREVLAILDMKQYDFEEFSKFDAELSNPEALNSIIGEGASILKFKDAKVEQLCKNAYLVDLSAILGLEDPTMQIPCVNTPIFFSEVGNYLARNNIVAMTWYKAPDGKCRYSLRSKGKYDCTLLAKRWGGGGHVDAAGFAIDEPLPAMPRKS